MNSSKNFFMCHRYVLNWQVFLSFYSTEPWAITFNTPILSHLYPSFWVLSHLLCALHGFKTAWSVPSYQTNLPHECFRPPAVPTQPLATSPRLDFSISRRTSPRPCFQRYVFSYLIRVNGIYFAIKTIIVPCYTQRLSSPNFKIALKYFCFQRASWMGWTTWSEFWAAWPPASTLMIFKNCTSPTFLSPNPISSFSRVFWLSVVHIFYLVLCEI